MTERLSATGGEAREFIAKQATLRAVKGEKPGELIVPETQAVLLKVDLEEDGYDFMGRIKQQDVWFRRLAQFGEVNGLALERVHHYSHLASDMELIQDKMDGDPEMQERVLAVKGLVQDIKARRDSQAEQYITQINEYLKSLDGFYPYWAAIGHETPRKKVYNLAQVEAISLDEDQTLRTFLRQSDGDQGYVNGPLQLYR